MAITGIDALTGFGFNQSNTQSLTQAPQPASEKPANIGGAATSQDQFTPSALNGQQNTSQAAGLFTVTQFAPFTAAADAFLAAAPTVLINQETAALNVNPATVPANHNLFAQPAALQGNPAAPTVTVAPTAAPNTFLARPAALQGNPAAPNITAAPKDIAGAPVLGFAANQAAPSAPNANTAPLAAPVAVAANATAQAGGTATPPASPAAGTTNAATTGSASIAEQLQALNTALQALGLGPRDIHQIDQIASVIKDFNPAAFTSLAYQLAALASPAATQQPPASAATAGLGRP